MKLQIWIFDHVGRNLQLIQIYDCLGARKGHVNAENIYFE